MKNRLGVTRWCIVLVLVSTTALVAQAQITPSDDAYVLTSQVNTNFGASGNLSVQAGAATGFIRFDLSGVPSGSTLSKATLKLFVGTVTTSGTFDVDRVNSSWTEKTVTQNSEPGIGSVVIGNVSISTANRNGYILVDVTPAVSEWLSGTTVNNGIAL